MGKTALVTGAGSGLGRAVAIGLAAQGADVILVGRREHSLRETQEIIRTSVGLVRDDPEKLLPQAEIWRVG